MITSHFLIAMCTSIGFFFVIVLFLFLFCFCFCFLVFFVFAFQTCFCHVLWCLEYYSNVLFTYLKERHLPTKYRLSKEWTLYMPAKSCRLSASYNISYHGWIILGNTFSTLSTIILLIEESTFLKFCFKIQFSIVFRFYLLSKLFS